MCGIVGYVGSNRAVDYVLEGLARLEYRGYDSTGVAVVDGGRVQVRRKKGKLQELRALLEVEPLVGKTAIGHTRWATHGRPVDENAHPHFSGDIALVHNGIIENYQELFFQLEHAGRQFTSTTDTELIAHLIAMQEGDSLLSRVQGVLPRLSGSYAIAVISETEPDTIVIAKNASPLIIGVHEQAGLVASDIPALLSYTRDIIVLEEGQMAQIRPGEVSLFDPKGNLITPEIQKIAWSPVMAEKGGHKHFMHKEIFEQGRVLGDTIRGSIQGGGSRIYMEESIESFLRDAQHVVLTGCGTSYHACLMGRVFFEHLAGVPCSVEVSSELRYGMSWPTLGRSYLAVSQSGETADTLAALTVAQGHGAQVASVVNVLGSSMARVSDAVFYTHAGPEIGVASTKAFVCQVTALLLMALRMAQLRGQSEKQISKIVQELCLVPALVEDILKQESHIVSIAQVMAESSSCLYIGRGLFLPLALEGALKLKEVSYIHAEGYPAGELKHGPIALIDKGVPVVALVNEGELGTKMLASIEEVRARDAFVVALGIEGDERLQGLAHRVISMPKCNPFIQSILAPIPLQLLAYHTADLRGTDVDQPRNLAKSVTVE